MDWKKIGKRLLFPPVWVMVILAVVCGAALVLVFLKGWEETFVAYPVYVLSFYTVSVLTVYFAMVLPKRYRQIKDKVYENPLGNRYMTDVEFKTHISLWRSFLVNMLFVAVQAVSYFLYHSAWFAILAIYYVILAVMRFLLVRYMGKTGIGKSMVGEWKRSRICAFILLLVNLTLSGAVLMILYQNKGYHYNGILIYVMALYTFYITINAIVNIVRYHKYSSPVLSTTKIITLCAALVSMLSLETAMLEQFGADMPAQDQQIMVAATGAGVSIVVVTLSIMLITKATKEIRSYQHGKQQ